MPLHTPDKTITYEVRPDEPGAARLQGNSKFEVVFSTDPQRPDYTTHVVHQGGTSLVRATYDIVVLNLSPDAGIRYIRELVVVALTGVDQQEIDTVQKAILAALDSDPFIREVREKVQR